MYRAAVLIVDDEVSVRDLLADALGRWGYRTDAAASAPEALELITHRLYDVALVDVVMEAMDGLALLAEIKRRDVAADVVMVTGRPTVATAVRALKAGASDYLEKPLDLDELHHSLGRLVEQRLLRREVAELRIRLGKGLPAPELIGSTPAIQAVRDLVDRVASSSSPILIEGESGTGKELVACAVHRGSSRRDGPFVPVNCGAIPAELMESQFFGHVRGAFSGAVATAPGLFRSAHGGTLFLDEVGELPLALQVKLLRALQDKEVRPVGAVESVGVDVRVVAATNRHIDAAVKDGSFRQDLFYRLNVVRIAMPPLRERREDIPSLVAHVLRGLNERYGRSVRGITPAALDALVAHDFPGNVRELENVLERAYAFGAREEIGLTDLPPLAARGPAAGGASATLAHVERGMILQALGAHGGDKARAARALGISRRTLYRRLRDYHVR